MPFGLIFYSSLTDVRADQSLYAYLHVITRAWESLGLAGVLCDNGRPTLYLVHRKERISPEDGSNLQRLFWNQGVATVLVVADCDSVRIYSGLAKPARSVAISSDQLSLVETLTLADYALSVDSFLLKLATGQYYRNHPAHFDTSRTVDAYLLNNLQTLRDKLVNSNSQLTVETAHTFLARILFVCYLIDRGIIDLCEYIEQACPHHTSLGNLLESLKTADAKQRMLHSLFSRLKEDFNGSMFDPATLTECRQLSAGALQNLTDFLLGHELGTGQYTLGFWAYDFRFIPVETISAIYEDFLKREDETEKHTAGAFYTPRFLAETVVDLALRNGDSLENKRFLDPSCGSGIFLVTLFNRLAAAWSTRHPKFSGDYDRKAEALKDILRDQICGIDKNLTACQIACFSLYLAFLDCFDPPSLQRYISQKGKLPNLLKRRNQSLDDVSSFSVIYEEDFLSPTGALPRDFDYVVGNPPWSDRGAAKGLHHQFALKIPEYLRPSGTACLLLPSKTFLNDQTNRFQEDWLRKVTLEEVVQLADYRKILFKEAKCPCMIVRLRAAKPNIAEAEIQYVAPKVTRIDIREGVIPIAPADRKSIPLRQILVAAHKQEAPAVWKQFLWGTPRDIKFLELLGQMPTLGDISEQESDLNKRKAKQTKQFRVGQGFKPVKKDVLTTDRELVPCEWNAGEPFVAPSDLQDEVWLPEGAAQRFGDHIRNSRCHNNKLYSKPSEKLFTPPLILVNQGFSVCAFFDYVVRFRDSLQSIAGHPNDTDLLFFLAAYLRSPLARYFLFHTSANWGTERDKVHLTELLRIPFPLPSSEFAGENAQRLIKQVANMTRSFIRQFRSDNHIFSTDARKRQAKELQDELNTLVYQYFGLIKQEIILIEDTEMVYIPSATPGDVRKPIPSQTSIDRTNVGLYSERLVPYARTLNETLTDWAKQSGSNVKIAIKGGHHKSSGMVCLTVELTTESRPFKEETPSDSLIAAAVKLAASASTRTGCLDYLRGVIVFHGTQIYIFKPDTLINWTRTAALNDAAEIYARIAHARQTSRETCA